MGPIELLSHGAEAGQVRLSRDLLVGIGLGRGIEPQRVRDAVHDLRDRSGRWSLQLLEDRLGSRPAQERTVAHLVRDTGGRERFLERLGAGVDPVQDRHLFQRDAFGAELVDGLHDRRHLFLHVVDGPREHRWTGLDGRLERLAEPAQVRGELVREPQDLGRGAVVALQADDRGGGEPVGECRADGRGRHP